MVAGKTIGETVATNLNFSTLNSLLKATSIDLDVAGGGTLFAPTNRAFSRLRTGFLDELIASPRGASATLLRHLIPKQSITVSDMKKSGDGFWYSVPGGPLSFSAGGVARIKIAGGACIEGNIPEDICDNGIIHIMEDVIIDLPRTIYEPLSINQQGNLGSVSTTAVIKVGEMSAKQEVRARKAAGSVGTMGKRKAMGLMTQLPFWMYGPPYNACKQEDFEPISIAQPAFGVGVDYQLMPPGSVVVVPDEVSSNKLNPVSGMSKYIGKTQRLVEGDGLSDYSRLDDI